MSLLFGVHQCNAKELLHCPTHHSAGLLVPWVESDEVGVRNVICDRVIERSSAWRQGDVEAPAVTARRHVPLHALLQPVAGERFSLIH
jgi:hypothetical protein